jgi:FKBP-type peptidyl-prolyl cis-trans isomerase
MDTESVERSFNTGNRSRPRSKLAEQNEKIRALLGLENSKTPDQVPSSTTTPEEPTIQSKGQTSSSSLVDVTGDGGVFRKVVARAVAAEGAQDEGTVLSAPGCRLRVHYVGKLADSGQIFDSSRERQEPFEFTLGEGSVIKGWEAGLMGLSAGDTVRLVCGPGYAYGLRGVPPVIPPRAKLEFEIQVLDVIPTHQTDKQVMKGQTLAASDEKDIPRTPEDIARAYMKRLEERDKNPSKKSKWFIISPFASSTGERPPWWLNPNITFLIIFSVLGLATYAVYVSGGIRQGFPSP